VLLVSALHHHGTKAVDLEKEPSLKRTVPRTLLSRWVRANRVPIKWLLAPVSSTHTHSGHSIGTTFFYARWTTWVGACSMPATAAINRTAPFAPRPPHGHIHLRLLSFLFLLLWALAILRPVVTPQVLGLHFYTCIAWA
jgi:hypothetical protein